MHRWKSSPRSSSSWRGRAVLAPLCGPPIRDHRDLSRIDLPRFARFYHYLLDAGVYLPPSCLDAACLSLAHRLTDLESVLPLFEQAIAISQRSGAAH